MDGRTQTHGGFDMADHLPERMIETRGIEICSDAYGDPSHPTVLLIMGASASMLMWDENFCQRLADGGRFVVRYDNRDTGRTTHCPPGAPDYTLQDMADDAIAVLDAYGVEQAHIIGASMGGMISQVVGLEHPSRVLTLTPIMSTPDPGAVMDAMEGREASYELSPPTPEVMASMLSTLTLDWSDREAVLQNRLTTFRALAGSAHAYDEPGRAKLFASEIDRAIDFASTQNHGPAIEKSERWHQRLGSLDVPTLVIHGTEDGILPYDHGEALARSIPGAKLFPMQGVGHEMPEGEMDRIIPAILEHTR